MKILITGAAGFVGSALAARLLSDGHEVIGLDSFSDYYDVAIKEANIQRITSERFRLVRGAIEEEDLHSLLDGVEIVYHEAGQPGVRKSWGDDFTVYTKANIEATQLLLEAARLSPSIRRIVYASSSSVYGDAESYPTRESDRPQPLSPYGVTKLAAEHLCSLYATNFQLPTISLRYFTVYGPGQRPDMAFTRFTRAAVLDEPIPLYGTGEQVRDFTYIDDVVQANVLAGVADVAPGSVFNVSGGSNVSVNEVLEIIEDLSGATLKVDRRGVVAGDVFRTGGDTVAISRELGWMPTVNVKDGLRNQLAWARETFGAAVSAKA